MSPVTVRGRRPREVAADIKVIRNRVEDVSPAWPSVGQYLSRSVRKQFVTEGSHFGTPWKPLKPFYRLWKVRNGFSRKILRRSGELMQSFTGRPMDIERYGRQEARFGSDLDKAKWHHGGTKRNGRRVNPPRPILKVTRDVQRDVKEIIENWIRKGRVR